MTLLRSLAATGLLSCGVLAAPTAVRAETYATCAGFIDTLPATITTQGVWCMKKDLTTALATGNAITVNANNVTIDCNGFKLGGQSAGAGTGTIGIYSLDRLSTTMRNCNVRGFMYGMSFSGTGGGHAVEDSRFDGNTAYGIVLAGDGSVVRRNRIFDTGGSTLGFNTATGIWVMGAVDVTDNTITGVAALAVGNAGSEGIHAYQVGDATITGNRVRGLASVGQGKSYGIFTLGSARMAITGNFLFDTLSGGGVGIACTANGQGETRDNVINGFVTQSTNCVDITPAVPGPIGF